MSNQSGPGDRLFPEPDPTECVDRRPEAGGAQGWSELQMWMEMVLGLLDPGALYLPLGNPPAAPCQAPHPPPPCYHKSYRPTWTPASIGLDLGPSRRSHLQRRAGVRAGNAQHTADTDPPRPEQMRSARLRPTSPVWTCSPWWAPSPIRYTAGSWRGKRHAPGTLWTEALNLFSRFTRERKNRPPMCCRVLGEGEWLPSLLWSEWLGVQRSPEGSGNPAVIGMLALQGFHAGVSVGGNRHKCVRQVQPRETPDPPCSSP